MTEPSFTSRKVAIDGLNFHYTDWSGDGPPLLMLHGLGGHARTWDHTAAALSDQYHVLALDQRGHGDTDWAPRYGLRPMAQDLLGFMNALDLPEATLMGLSMGGLVSFVFAAAHPERVTRMAILDIGPEVVRSLQRRTVGRLAGSRLSGAAGPGRRQRRSRRRYRTAHGGREPESRLRHRH
jgi:pimeloyl-ACP methyl ester carboxylesterase